MAKGKNQLLVGLSGSLENMTIVQAADGDAIVKGKIVQTTNRNTPAQQLQRYTLKSDVASYNIIPALVKSRYETSDVMHSPYNAFTSFNMKKAKKKARAVFTPAASIQTNFFTNGSDLPVPPSSSTNNPTFDSTTGATVLFFDVDQGHPLYNAEATLNFYAIQQDGEDYRWGEEVGLVDDGEIAFTLPIARTGEWYIGWYLVDPATGLATPSRVTFKLRSSGAIETYDGFDNNTDIEIPA